MNKLVYLAIGGIWTILIAIVAYGIWAAPNIDVLFSLQKYKVVGQTYLDRQEVVPSDIRRDTPDDELVFIYAEYMKDFQRAENSYNAAHKLFNVAIEPRNLLGSGSLNNAYQRLQTLTAQTVASYELLARTQQRTIEEVQKLDPENMEVFGSNLDNFIEAIEVDEIPFRDEVTRKRLALEKYYKAMLDFLAQKAGQFKIDGRAIYFNTVEDQRYFEQLQKGRKEFETDLRKAFEQYQNNLRKTNAKIPVDIK